MHFTETKNPEYIVSRFCIAGINFRNAALKERSLFSIEPAKQLELLSDAKHSGFRSLFALSTCNRSELYAFCETDTALTELFLKHTRGPVAAFRQYGFIKRGYEAFDYLFRVTSGLESQITGDYEIAGQLKTAVARSRSQQLIGPYMHRSLSFALQASKAVRSSTQLSNGTVSVSYAAIKWLETIDALHTRSILLLGAGNLGRSIARNIRHYLEPASLTIMNRTPEPAMELAGETNAIYQPFNSLAREAAKADVIIVCTNSPVHLLHAAMFTTGKPLHILDLSVPENVHPAVKEISEVRLSGIDEVSQTMNASFRKRQGEVPRANAIIQEHLDNFYAWLSLYRHTAAIKDVKDKLYSLSQANFCQPDAAFSLAIDRRINKTVGTLALNLRNKNEKGCQYINAINEFLQAGNG